MKKGFLNQISKIIVSTAFISSALSPLMSVDVFAAYKPTETHEIPRSDLTYTYKDVDRDGRFDTLIIEGDDPIPTYDAFGDDAAPWIAERSNIAEIIIEDGVKSIGECAFYQFDRLEEITIPDSVKYIGEGAFYKCSKLESIDLPDSIDIIERNTFTGCFKLETVTIPKYVTEIDFGAFGYCTKLKRVNFAGNNLETIGAYVFTGCGFEEFEIPEGVEIVKENVFYGCKDLEKVVVPKSVEKIGIGAFEECELLEEVVFDCRSKVEFNKNWGIEEEFFIKEHEYRNGVCTVCYKKDETLSDDDDDDDVSYTDWDEIIEDTEMTFGTTTYNVKMGTKDTTVPYDVFYTLKGKNTVLNIKINNTFSWSIKGGDIKTPKKLNLGVEISDKEIPLNVMSKYTKDYNYTELELSGNGDFGLKAELTIDVGTINNGNNVDLYYYDPDDADSLEFIANSEVKNGKVTLPFTHASKYVIDMYKDKEKDDDDDDSFDFDDFAAGENVVVKEIIL